MESVKQDEYDEVNVSQSYIDESALSTSDKADDMTDREKRIGWMGFTVIVIILVFYYTIELIHFFHR